MTEVEIQNHFVQSLVILLTWLDNNGYQVTLGEAYRPQITADYYAKLGKGIHNSQHTKRLAIDLNLFKNGAMLLTKEDYEPAGKFWEALSSNGLPHIWGGNFTKKMPDGTVKPAPDSDHFSIRTNGVA